MKIAIFSDIDDIQEFKVLTYNYSAEYGERAGPTVLVTTKYGIPGLKYAMDLGGYYGGPPRLPLTVPTPEAKKEIEREKRGEFVRAIKAIDVAIGRVEEALKDEK